MGEGAGDAVVEGNGDVRECMARVNWWCSGGAGMEGRGSELAVWRVSWRCGGGGMEGRVK